MKIVLLVLTLTGMKGDPGPDYLPQKIPRNYLLRTRMKGGSRPDYLPQKTPRNDLLRTGMKNDSRLDDLTRLRRGHGKYGLPGMTGDSRLDDLTRLRRGHRKYGLPGSVRRFSVQRSERRPQVTARPQRYQRYRTQTDMELRRKRRQVVGEWSSKPVNGETSEQGEVMAKFAVPHVQKDINSSAFFKLSSIESVLTQVVSGTNYRINMTLEETTCAAAAYNGSECAAASPSKRAVCTVLVFDQSWTNTRNVTDSSCELSE